MATLIKGTEISKKIMNDIKLEVAKLDEKPTIVVIIVGNDPASRLYVSKKKENVVEVGMNSIVVEMDEKVSQKELEQKIDELNNDDKINAILVQLPLPKHINTYDIIQRISPQKDVDGFHPDNVGKLSIGLAPYAVSCTPAGIIKLLDEYGIDIESKNAVIIGRSNIVGKPLSNLLLARNATVTVCHSKTKDISKVASKADILVSAVGNAEFVKSDWVKEGAVVIDVGINRNSEGKLVGDVDFKQVESKASFITPVPGGVGPMTRAMLLFNALQLYKLQKGIN